MKLETKDKKHLIEKLENLASEVLKLKNQSVPRRPIVIEFCGSPKAGKSSCINSLELFLRRNGFRTRLLTERASVCPVKNKFDPYFNVWTVTSVLAELVEILSNHSKKYDVVIMDRGVFDGLCWFNFLRTRGNLDDDNFSSLESFLLMNKLKAVIDLIYIFTASAEVSLSREYANLLTEKTGSIMKPEVLDAFRESITSTAYKYDQVYQRIEVYDTSNKELNLVNYEVTNNILEILRENIEEKIGYFKTNEIDFDLGSTFSFSSAKLKDLNLNFDARHRVEDNDNFIQPIPILVIKEKQGNRAFVVRKNKKRTSKESPETGKTLLYLGGHIRKEDMYHSKEKDLLSISKYTLSREVKEEIGIDYHPSKNEINPLCLWVRNNNRSKKHLAICFVLTADLDLLKVNLDVNEFVTTGNTKSGKVFDVVELAKNENEFEDWSKLILAKLFDINHEKQLDFDV